MDLRTLKAFYDSIGSKGNTINQALLDNIKSRKEKEIVLNLVQLQFNFSKNYVVIVYFIEGKKFPDKILSFEEFENILKNEAGAYNFTNALLLSAIIDCGGVTKGTELKNIIDYTDRLNYPILKFEEFNASIKYLFQLGLVEEIDKRYFVNKNWYNKKFRHRPKNYKLGMIKNLQKQLYMAEKNYEFIENIETKITEIDFENTIEEYIMGVK